MHRKIGRAQQQSTPLTKPLLNQLLDNCDNSIMGIRNQVLLRLGYETMRRRSELCAFKFTDISQAPNGKSVIKLNFSKTDQFGTGKIIPISEELLTLLHQWQYIVGDNGYVLRSIRRHGNIGQHLSPSSVSVILKTVQATTYSDKNTPPLSGHSFRVGCTRPIRARRATGENHVKECLAEWLNSNEIFKELDRLLGITLMNMSKH